MTAQFCLCWFKIWRCMANLSYPTSLTEGRIIWMLSHLSLSLPWLYYRSHHITRVFALHLQWVSLFVVYNSTIHHSCHHLSFMPEGTVSGSFVSACICLFTHVNQTWVQGEAGFSQSLENPSRPPVSHLLWLTSLMIMTSAALRQLMVMRAATLQLRTASRLEAEEPRWGRIAESLSSSSSSVLSF